LGFETLTFAPIDRRLIDTGMLSARETAWLDDYHRQVLALIGPQLQGEDLTWLETQCAPLGA
jgi:Xaa-Pro aminopeptidase